MIGEKGREKGRCLVSYTAMSTSQLLAVPLGVEVIS